MTYKQRCEIMEKALNDIIYLNMNPTSEYVLRHPTEDYIAFLNHLKRVTKIAMEALKKDEK